MYRTKYLFDFLLQHSCQDKAPRPCAMSGFSGLFTPSEIEFANINLDIAVEIPKICRLRHCFSTAQMIEHATRCSYARNLCCALSDLCDSSTRI